MVTVIPSSVCQENVVYICEVIAANVTQEAFF